MNFEPTYLQYTDAQNQQANVSVKYAQTFATPPFTKIEYIYDHERMRYVGKGTDGKTYIIQYDDPLPYLYKTDKHPFDIEYQTDIETDCPEVLDLLTDP